MLTYVRVQNKDDLPKISHLRPFKAIVIIEGEVLEEWQSRASTWLVNSGCLYMMAWGQNCSSWDDSVDNANLEQWDLAEIPDEAFVMTTWHDSEPLADVFFYAKYSAHHPTVEVKNILILHIGSKNKKDIFEIMFQEANETN